MPRQHENAGAGASRAPLKRALRWALPLAAGVGLSAYYRFRPQPPGVDGVPASFRVPADSLTFMHNTSWYEDGERFSQRCIHEEMANMIRRSRRLVVMDVFLFNLHHAEGKNFEPLTRQIADAFGGKQHPCYFITDPLNTFYGTSECPPLGWLRERGVTVCVTNLRRLRDNNLVYSPIWRSTLQWFGTQGRGSIQNPLEPGHKTTIRALLEAINLKGNHRKVLIADDGDDWVTLVGSANLEDSGSHYCDVALKIRSQAVARHFLAAEKAVAAMSGVEIKEDIPPAESDGDVLLTPLMGARIKAAALEDIRRTRTGDELWVFMLFLAERDIVEALVEAANRGVRVTVTLDVNRISFGSKKGGFPNQFVAVELQRRANIEIRWGNLHLEEFHSKLTVIRKPDRCIFHVGSANFTRRGLSSTVLEANVRVEAPLDVAVTRQVFEYVDWVNQEPRTLAAPGSENRLRYWWYRMTEATGLATF